MSTPTDPAEIIGGPTRSVVTTAPRWSCRGCGRRERRWDGQPVGWRELLCPACQVPKDSEAGPVRQPVAPRVVGSRPPTRPSASPASSASASSASGRGSHARDVVQQLLAEHPGLTVGEIVSRSGLSEKTVRRALHRVAVASVGSGINHDPYRWMLRG
jgi:hypothetical protein